MRPSLIPAYSLSLLFGCADAAAYEPDALLAAGASCPPSPPSPTQPAGVTYEVVDLATGLLRTAVVKRDPRRGLCTRVILVHGGGVRAHLSVHIDAPQVALERAWIDRDLQRCDDVSPAPPPGAVTATAAAGTIRIGSPGRCLLDLDLNLTFPQGEEWVPATESLRVRGLDSSFACLVR
jgi:hypothetical protein